MRPGSPRPTRRSTPRRATPSSRWASCVARRRTSPPTCPTSSSPTCRSSSTTSSAARSVRPSASSASGSRPSYRRIIEARGDRGPRARRGRRRHRAPRRAERARGVEGRRHRRRERLHDGAQDRPGQGAARGRLRRAAAALGRQGRLLREAHRRDGCRRGALRAGRAAHRLDPRRPDAPPARQQAIDAFNNDPGRRRSRSARSPRPASA